jgi:hypothetical protein
MRHKPKFKFKKGDRVKAEVNNKTYSGVVKDIYFEFDASGKFLELYWIIFNKNEDGLIQTWVHPKRMEKDEEQVVFT